MAGAAETEEQEESSAVNGAQKGGGPRTIGDKRSVWERLPLGRVLIGLVLAGFAGFILFSLDVKPVSLLRESAREELASKLLQLAVLSAAGALLAILTFEYQRRQKKTDDEEREKREKQERDERDERQEREEEAREDRQRARETGELLKEMLGRSLTAYNTTKGVRRMIRARCTGTARLKLEDYDRYIAEINGAQLELERVKREAELVKGRLPGADQLARVARDMEKYLNNLISEYEEDRHLIGDEGVDLTKFSRLADFYEKEEDSPFYLDFADPFSAARKKIREELLRLDGLNVQGREDLDAEA